MRVVVPLLLVPLVGCYAAPELGKPTSPRTTLQHVFASDLSHAGFARREAGMARTLTLMLGEPARAARLAPRLGDAAAALAGDSAAMVPAVERMLAAELGHARRLHLPAVPDIDPAKATRRLLTGVAELPTALGLTQRPLRELDDAEHRTDPHDDRPEATWLARLRRRLAF